MPKDSLTVYLTAVDQMSPVVASITDKTKALDKETQQLQATTNSLAKANQTLLEKQTKLQSELSSSAKTVKEMQKAYDEYGDELSKARLDSAIEQHAKLKNQLVEVNAQLDTNRRTYKENIEAIRKGGLEGQETSLGSIANGLKNSQLGQMFASSVGAGLQSIFTSEIGTPEASLISGTISNAITGLTTGMIAGPAGAAIGAGVGALSGLISGGTKIYEAKDDAFKDYYGGLYSDVKGRSGEMAETGSAIAGGREQNRMAFSQRLGGDDEAADYLRHVEVMAAKTNYDYDEIVGYAKLLLNSYDPDEVFGVLQDLSDATAGLNLSSSDVNMMISGLSRMRTTGKATQEYLNYFRERGVDTDQALADALGMEKSSIADKVKKGEVGGEAAAQAILEYIEKTFGGLSEDLAGTYDAMTDNLGDLLSTIQAYGGEAYNDLRKTGIGAQMEAYESDLGDALKEINAVIGENQARKENLQDQYMREVLDAVLNGAQGALWSTFDAKQQKDLTEMNQQYADWQARYEASKDENGIATDAEAGARMEALYETAQSLGQAYFDNSDLMKILNDAELDEVEAIREATKGLSDATDATYALTQELSKGRGLSGIGSVDNIRISSDSGNASHRARLAGVSLGSHAYGLDRVPYDGYPALLHRDERVLTASEARAQDAAQTGAAPIQVTITGNSFTGTPEEMADTLAEILVRKLSRAAIAAAPQ